MALRKIRETIYGDSQFDIREMLLGYSQVTGYPATHFGDAVCECAGRRFRLLVDDKQGAALRTCDACGHDHAIGDSDAYLEVADLERCECPCGAVVFEITAGVCLYPSSGDVLWIYLGCRCPECGQTACYGDWKNEYSGFRELLQRI